jgi:hypothetical protein
VVHEHGVLVGSSLLAAVTPELLIERPRFAQLLGGQPVVRQGRRVHLGDPTLQIFLGVVGFLWIERVVRIGHPYLLARSIDTRSVARHTACFRAVAPGHPFSVACVDARAHAEPPRRDAT